MEQHITSSQSIVVATPGLHAFTIEGSNLNLTFDVTSDASLFLTYRGTQTQVNIKMDVKDNTTLQVLHWNECKEALSLQVEQSIHKDATLHVGFAELSNQKADIKASLDLVASGAQVHTSSASIAEQHVHLDLVVRHLAPHTQANMENYAIVKRGGDLRIYDEGKIVKGAYASASHQTTRVLTLDKEQKSEVLPLLLIDENDVQASHATSLGQPDENQLYYLQTRGLSRTQALGLMSIGYLMPIAEVLSDEALIEVLRERITKRVESL
ncbi:MAG: SufB/SufD family protein [Erysipelotrichaceae bacterium]